MEGEGRETTLSKLGDLNLLDIVEIALDKRNESICSGQVNKLN